MNTTARIALLASSTLFASASSTTAWAQRGPGARGGAPAARSAGYRAPGVGANMSPGPSMSRPAGAGPGAQRPGAGAQGGLQRPNAGIPGGLQRPNVGQPGGIQPPNAASPGGIQRPNVGSSPISGREPGGMQRPNAGPAGIQRPNVGDAGGLQRPNAGEPGGVQRPNADAIQRPNAGDRPGGIQRPNAGAMQRPNAGDQPGGIQRPNPGASSGLQRPGGGGQGGTTSGALQDFLGGGASSSGPGNRLPQGIQRPEAGRPSDLQRPRPGAPGGILDQRPGANGGGTNVGNQTNIGTGNRTSIGSGNRTNVGIGGNTTNVNVGNVNLGNQVNYTNNNQAWVNQRQTWGNNVRTNVGGRYNNVFNASYYRGGFVTGGYNYYGGWAARGPYYAWSPVTWAAIGGFFGGAWATAQPVYYAYGQGGNVYYENNVVYVNGQASGTPQEYYQQTQALAAAAPPVDQVNAQPQDWLPLGVFALTSEDTGDSQTVLQLAVNKQGVIAGTYYNEGNQVSRPIQGTADVKTQRAVMTFADNKNSDRVLETGINNLTQDEAPSLLHFGAEQSQPMLLVRLKQPQDTAPSQ